MAWIILKGLPNTYDNFTSYKYEDLAKDLNNINITKLINNLILKEGRFNTIINLEANKTSYNNNQSYYKHCNKKGHIEDKCFIKYLELRNNYFNSNKKKNKFNKKSFKKNLRFYLKRSNQLKRL
jgi:hypothetical protein